MTSTESNGSLCYIIRHNNLGVGSIGKNVVHC